MQKRNLLTHAAVIGVLLAVSLGIFEAVGAASNPAIASSNKFSGPTEPTSSWYYNGERGVSAGVAGVVATPAAGAALVVQSITYATLASPSQLLLFPDSATDPHGTCESSVSP